MISPLGGITPTKPGFATLPLPGVFPVLMDEDGNEIEGNDVQGNLCIKHPWPSIARTVYGDHQRFIDTYFTAFPGRYFSQYFEEFIFAGIYIFLAKLSHQGERILIIKNSKVLTDAQNLMFFTDYIKAEIVKG